MNITSEFSHLWNDLPDAERKRLMPEVIESQKNHIIQCRVKAVRAHKSHLADLDQQIKRLEEGLSVYRRINDTRTIS